MKNVIISYIGMRVTTKISHEGDITNNADDSMMGYFTL